MAETPTPQFDFLTDYLLALLEENNISLTDEQKKIFLPRMLAQIEQRLGIELLPKLGDEDLSAFNDMLARDDVSSEEWEAFWQKAVPTFQEDVKSVLKSFAEEVSELLSA
jgi:hypothetical protein